MTLRARLLLALVPLFVLCLVAADAATYAEQQSFLYGQLQQQAQSGASLVAGSAPGGGGQTGPRVAARRARITPGVVWGEVLSATGGVVDSPEFLGVPTQDRLSATVNHPELPGPVASKPGQYITVSGVGSYSQYLVYIEPAGAAMATSSSPPFPWTITTPPSATSSCWSCWWAPVWWCSWSSRRG